VMVSDGYYGVVLSCTRSLTPNVYPGVMGCKLVIVLLK